MVVDGIGNQSQNPNDKNRCGNKSITHCSVMQLAALVLVLF
jgi:hypothetical protein